jgi:hypothetical protein
MPLAMTGRARLAGALLAIPLLPFLLWLDPPALTWVATIYLVVVSGILAWCCFAVG